MRTWTDLLPELEGLTTKELRGRYAELFGEATPANNRVWLLRRIAWRLQARAEGGLSERARRRAAELADESGLRLNPPTLRRPAARAIEAPAAGRPGAVDRRLPPPGTVLCRGYKGREVRVRVLAAGVEYEGKTFPSLSAAAKAVT